MIQKSVEIYRNVIKKNYMVCNLKQCNFKVNLISKPNWVNSVPNTFTLKDSTEIQISHTLDAAPTTSIRIGEMIYETPFGTHSFTVKAIY